MLRSSDGDRGLQSCGGKSHCKLAHKGLGFFREVLMNNVAPSVVMSAGNLSRDQRCAEDGPLSARKQQRDLPLFNAAFDNSGHAMMIIRNDYVVVAFNKMSEKLTGWPYEQALGRYCWEIYHCDESRNTTRGDCLCPLIDSKERFGSYFRHTFNNMRDKTTSVTMSHAPLVWPGQDDSYEIIVAHHNIRQHSSLLMSKELIGFAAHELITPLNVIKGYSTTLIRMGDTLSSKEKERYLSNIEHIIDKACRSVDNFIDLYRVDTGHLDLDRQPTSLPRLIRRIVIDMQEQTTQNVIEFISPTKMPLVEVDHQRIEQVLSNLIVNATKYSPRGTDIEVKLECAQTKNELRAAGADVSVVTTPCLIVSVRDSGIGISEDNLRHIFDKFYRVKSGTNRTKSGVGLGLYISKILIQDHGGQIWAKSKVGQGSTFSFSLPLANAEPTN